jgi:acyl CoA:acetate/3-ketoacid CoA transferase alpha subunit
MNKVFSTADEAVADIPPGATVMLGGFGFAASLKTRLPPWYAAG